MKLVLSLALLLAPLLAWAEDGRNLMSVRLGLNQTLSEIEGSQKDKDGDAGIMFGFEYVRRLANPKFGLGIGVDSLTRSERHSASLIANTNSTVSGNSLAILALGKWFIAPEEKIQPYLGIGMGVGRSSLKATSTPYAGFVWSATGTSDTRTIVDHTDTGFAFALRAGLDIPVRDNLSVGGEAGYLAITGISHPATSQGQQVTGLTSLSGTQASLTFNAHLTLRL